MYFDLIHQIDRLDKSNKTLLISFYKQLFTHQPPFISESSADVSDLPYLLTEQNKENNTDQVIAVFGLDTRETVHQIIINDITRYTWCIWDAFFIAETLEQHTKIITADPITKKTITAVYNQGTWMIDSKCCVSFPEKTDSDNESLRSAFCGFVHLFTCKDNATSFSIHNSCEVLPVQTLIERGKEMATVICN